MNYRVEEITDTLRVVVSALRDRGVGKLRTPGKENAAEVVEGRSERSELCEGRRQVG